MATLAKSTTPAEQPESGRITGFRKDLILLVLDKLVFGLLILGAAFLLNRILDQHRAQTTFEAEFAKVRAERVAGILSLAQRRDGVILVLANAELQAVDHLRALHEALNAGDAVEAARARAALSGAALRITAARSTLGNLPEVEPRLDATRFWLGRRLYDRIHAHVTLEQKLETSAPEIANTTDATTLERSARRLRAEARRPLDIDEVTRILSSGG